VHAFISGTNIEQVQDLQRYAARAWLVPLGEPETRPAGSRPTTAPDGADPGGDGR
jgi:hypothetical protein